MHLTIHIIFRPSMLQFVMGIVNSLACGADVAAGSTIHLVTRPVDVTQQPPQSPSGQWSMGGGAGAHFGANLGGMPGMHAGLERNDIGTVWGLAPCCLPCCRA